MQDFSFEIFIIIEIALSFFITILIYIDLQYLTRAIITKKNKKAMLYLYNCKLLLED